MNRFFVRTAGARDLAAISELLSATWHVTYDSIYGSDRVRHITKTCHSIEALTPRLTRPSAEFLVADDGERIAGVAFAAAGPDGRTVMLHQLYVSPPHQGIGVGSELLVEVADAYPDADRLRLEVEDTNVDAVRFFTRRGFVRIGTADRRSDSEISAAVSVYERLLT